MTLAKHINVGRRKLSVHWAPPCMAAGLSPVKKPLIRMLKYTIYSYTQGLYYYTIIKIKVILIWYVPKKLFTVNFELEQEIARRYNISFILLVESYIYFES